MPPYATFPVVRAGEQPAQSALAYAEQLFSGMLYSGGGLGLTDYALSDVSVMEVGDVYYRLSLQAQVVPQRQKDSEAGTLWGEPGEDGVCRLSLETVLYQAVGQDGQAYLCAVGRSIPPLPSCPKRLPWRPPNTATRRCPWKNGMPSSWRGPWRSMSFTRTSRPPISRRRRLVHTEGAMGYSYRITVSRLEDGRRTTLFDMPDSLGDLKVIERMQQGLLVTTWRYAYASSGWEGSVGYLTDEGFSPLLESAFFVGRRDQKCYLWASAAR